MFLCFVTSYNQIRKQSNVVNNYDCMDLSNIKNYRRRFACGNQSSINNHQSIISHHISEFLRRQEAWTDLGHRPRHLVMTSDDCLGKAAMEVEKEGNER